MATSAIFHLQPPHTDDAMDMSSPANRDEDDDIEIDFDDALDTNVDDQMHDDDQTHVELYDDEMQDDVPNAQVPPLPNTTEAAIVDDDLIDYSDEEVEEEITQGKPIPLDEAIADKTSETTGHETTAHVESPKADLSAVAESNLEIEEHLEPTETADESAAVQSEVLLRKTPEASAETDNSAAHDDVLVVKPQSSISDAAVTEQTSVAGDVSEEEPEEAAVPQIDTSAQPAIVLEVSTPTDTGLHPMMFCYNSQTYPMFKSQSSPDGLLKDDNLVSVSLADLMKACRQRLIIKTAQEINDSYEMLFLFENLHLSVIEDSPASFQTCLKDVLDVFIQLHENEGYDIEDIPTLVITCSLRIKFSNSIRILQQAAANGDGISNFTQYDVVDDIQHDDQDNGDEDFYEEEELEVEQDDTDLQQHEAGLSEAIAEEDDREPAKLSEDDLPAQDNGDQAAEILHNTELVNDPALMPEESAIEAFHDDDELDDDLVQNASGDTTYDDTAYDKDHENDALYEDATYAPTHANDASTASVVTGTNSADQQAREPLIITSNDEQPSLSVGVGTEDQHTVERAAGTDGVVPHAVAQEDNPIEDEFEFILDEENFEETKSPRTTPTKRNRDQDEDESELTTASKKIRAS